MGTPDFAVPSLSHCLAAGHDVCMVYTQPPRPAGRGMALQPSPVQRLAEARGIAVRSPKRLKDAAEQQAFAALTLDLAIVVAYGLILPKAILDAPRLGCINVHASLLPRWRGAAPIQRAIEAGDTETGITIMQMDEGLDTGAMLLGKSLAIGADMTAQSLHDQLAELGAKTLIEALSAIAAGRQVPQAQSDIGAIYAPKITKPETRIDWHRPAVEIDRRIRAFGGWTQGLGARIRIHRVQPVDGSGPPGTVLDNAPTVACGQGALRLIELQREGKAIQDAAAFLRGFALAVGTRLD